MGGTTYSHSAKAARTVTKGYKTKSREEVFKQRMIHADMEPKGVKMREARDSEAHPNSLPIIFALDVTASMGTVPHEFIKEGLPHIIEKLQKAGIESPAVMFMAIGDHKTDMSPLQISQFESGDAELDMWLENVWLEEGGGGNGGESYSLAHYFANSVCVTDHWEKRGGKGYIFTIGDEANHSEYASNRLEGIFGVKTEAFTDISQLEAAQEKWNVHHIIPGNKNYNEQGYWAGLLGPNAHNAESVEDVANVIVSAIVNTEGVTAKPEGKVKETSTSSDAVETKDEGNVML